MRTQRTRLEQLENRQGQARQKAQTVCVLVGAELTPEEEELLARPGTLVVPAFGEDDHMLEGFTGRVLGRKPQKPCRRLPEATGRAERPPVGGRKPLLEGERRLPARRRARRSGGGPFLPQEDRGAQAQTGTGYLENRESGRRR